MAIHPYSRPERRNFIRIDAVTAILTNCSATRTAEYFIIFLSAVKYPLSADDMATNGRQRASILSGLSVLTSFIH